MKHLAPHPSTTHNTKARVNINVLWQFGLAGILTMALQFTAPSLAQALEADKTQPLVIDANRMNYNEKSSVNTFSGNVLLTRGSLLVRGDKLTLTESKNGSQFARVDGGPARFKQQRDTPNAEILWINGTANTIEIDASKGLVTLSGQAVLQKTTNGQLTESISGNKIVYDQNTEALSVQGGIGQNTGQNTGQTAGQNSSRVQAIIKPKNLTQP